MMTNSLKPLTLAILAASATGLTGCLSSSSDGGGDDGTFSLGVTDAPVDSVQEVNVNFTGVTIKPADGEPREITLDEPVSKNLLNFQRGNAFSLVDNVEVQAGEYNWVKLEVDSSDISKMNVLTDGGGTFALNVPSGELKLVSGFSVPQGGAGNFTIDVELRKALINPANGDDFKLRPALRLVDNTEVGNIEGTLGGTFVENQCGSQEFKGAVYIYEGADITPFDLNSKAEQEPLMVAPAEVPEDSSERSYGAGFLAEGTYTISYTCSVDDPDAADDLSFAGTRNVEVVADETKTEDFGTN